MDPHRDRWSILLRTPHLDALLRALAERDHRFVVEGVDVVRVAGVAPDDLGWLAASAGVVVYEMVVAEVGTLRP